MSKNRFKVPRKEIDQRQFYIQRALQANDMDGLFIAERVDLFYFSGTAQSGFLFMPAEGEPLLFIKRYLPRALKESSIKNIFEIKGIKEIPGLVTDYYGRFPQVLGFELDVLPVNVFHFYQTLFRAKSFVDASSLILNCRRIKSEWEVEQMGRTAEMTHQTFAYIKEAIRPGLTEMEFSGMYETFSRKLGHGAMLRDRNFQSGNAYPWHILSGKSGGMVGVLDAPASGEGTSPAFPSGAGNKRLMANEPIMIDLGSVLNGYHMDETRMFAINSMPDKPKRACESAIEIHNLILEKAKPGVTVGELFSDAVKMAVSLGYKDSFLGPPGYKVKFIGHGIGLELIEPYIIAKGGENRLEPGMTFALEPKMVFQNEFSAGVESVFLVTQTGSRLISRVPLNIFICK